MEALVGPSGASDSARTVEDMEQQFLDAQLAIEEALERQGERRQRHEAHLKQQAAAERELVEKEAREAEQMVLRRRNRAIAAEENEEAHMEPDTEERDAKPVVDWTSEPDAEIARVSRLYKRPTYVIQKEQPPIAFWFDVEDGLETGLTVLAGGEVAHVEPGSEPDRRGVTTNYTLAKVGNTPVTTADTEADIRDMLSDRPIEVRFTGGATDKRLIFDKADAALDEKGWQTDKTKNGQTPQEYPCMQLDIEEMGTIGGVGLRLYFYLLSFLYTCFAVMAVLTTPSIIITYSEFDMYEHAEAVRYKTGLARTTLGNINTPVEELRAADEPIGSHSLWTISSIEALGSLFMLCMVLRAGHRMSQLVESVDKSAVTMADYTVMLQPIGVWKEYSALNKNKRDQLVQDVEDALEQAVPNAQLAQIDGETCIWIGWDDDENISLWNDKKAHLLKLEAALRAAYYGNNTPAEKIVTEVEEINAKMEALNGGVEWTPVYVFATYDLGEHFEKALAVKEVEIGGMTCRVLPAPEPESLQWEHLEYDAKERAKRKCKIMSLTFISLLIGAALITYAGALKVGTKYIGFCADVMGPDQKAEYSGVCPLPDAPEEMDAAAVTATKFYHHMFATLNSDPQIVNTGESTLRTSAPYEQCRTCTASSAGVDGEECAAADISDASTAQGNCESAGTCTFTAGPATRGTHSNPCHTVDSGTWETTEYLMAGGDLDAMCYACICTLTGVAETTKATLEEYYAANPSFLADSDSHDTYCAAMDKKVANASFWGNVATVIVVVINQVLKQGIRRSAPYAKAHTKEEEMVSTSLRVYAVQVLNTAILMLILRSEFSIFRTLPGEHYATVNAKWYAEVGAPLVMTMVIQFSTPPSVHIVMMLVNKLLRSIKGRSAKTQNQLNQSQAPDGFEIAAGYGEVLLATSVTLIFGAGIPLLYHVAAVGFFVRYNVEKWIIVRVTRKPPLYSKKLFETFDEMFAVLLLVHLAMAVYFMASAGGETPSTSYIYIDTVFFSGGLLANFHHHVWPVLGVFGLVVVGVACKFIAKCKCFEHCCEDDAEDEEENLPPFTEAYSAGLIINEDDDYMMDQFEELMDFIDAFAETLDNAKELKQPPFKGKDGRKFYRRIKAAVKPVLGKKYVRGARGANDAKLKDHHHDVEAGKPDSRP
eukprot:COSAG06_NODE_555_length_14353_cov_3.329311_5_plen_1164_part_00